MQKDSRKFFFDIIFKLGFAFAMGYSALFLCLGAYSAGLSIFIECSIFTALISCCEKKRQLELSRFILVASGVVYICSVRLWISTPLFAEYYFFPTMLSALLLFDPKNKIQITIATSFAAFGWVLATFGFLPFLVNAWTPTEAMAQKLRYLNFFGSAFMVGVFLFYYRRYLLMLQDQVSNELVHFKETVALLNESQSKAKLGSWDWTIGTNLVFWSQEQYNIFGRAPSLGVDADTYFSYLSPTSKAETLLLVEQAIKGNAAYSVEHEICLADGSKKLVYETGTVHFDKLGRPLRLSGTTQDITERKRLDTALISSTKLLEASQAIGKLGGWELNIATGKVFWTAEIYRILETSPEEHNPTLDSGIERFLPESRKIISEAINAAMEKGQGFDLELETLTRKDRKIYVRTTCEVIWQNGAAVTLRGIFQDITRQKEFNLELSSIKERLEIAIDSVQFGIWDWNLKTNVLTWDNNMYKIYDIQKENFSGDYDAFEKTLSPTDAERIKEELKNAFLKKQIHFESEFRIISKSGAIKYVKANAKCFYDSDGKIERVVGANWDNTIKKNAETILISSAKMASLGEMASGMAHEINTPLAIIQMKTQSIKRQIQTGAADPEKITDDLLKIDLTTTRIAKIVNGLRSFSRNADRDPLESVKLAKLIEESLELCRERFKYRGVVLNLSLTEDLNVECRPSQIVQVIMNLLSNAYDAVENLSEKWVNIDILNCGECVQLVITDSGQGISEDAVEKIMQPFFTTKEVGRGTGLGLSISKGIVEDHSGRLIYDATSTNTRFIVELPWHQPSAHGPGTPQLTV